MFRYVLRRIRALIMFSVLSVGIMLVGTTSANAEGAQPYVNVSLASCVDGSGQVTITMYPGSQATKTVDFIIRVDDASNGDPLIIPVAPNTYETRTVGNLADGSHRFEIIADDVTIFDNPRTVQCNNVPVGNYTNPQGSVRPLSGCGVVITASNYPIGNNLEGLQPVKFTATFVSNIGGPVQTLDAFTLPSGQDDAFDTSRTYAPGSPGVVSLYAEGMKPVHYDFTNACIVVQDTVHHVHKPKHHKPRHHSHNTTPVTTLPNTGFSVRQWEALAGFMMLLSGISLVVVSRRPVRIRIKR